MTDKPDKPFNFDKMKMSDGWYCVRDGIVINRSDLNCPAPIGSMLYANNPGHLTEEDNVRIVSYKDVVGWMEPEGVG